MTRRLAALLLLLLATLLLNSTYTVPQARAQDPSATPPAADATIPLYGLYETTVDTDAIPVNPYDPAQISIVAQFTAPSGRHVEVDAFWMQPYRNTCTQNCQTESLEVLGAPAWHVRFTPTEVGTWSYVMQQRDADTIRVLRSGSLMVVPSERTGFIRVGQNRRYFAYDNSTTYFPVGVNLGWSWDGGGGTLGYLEWLKQLNAVGANYARLYVDVPWFIGLDWHGKPGDYSVTQPDAWKLDQILTAAENYGIAIQIVLVWHQGFISYQGVPVNVPAQPTRPNIEADWSSNPYNVVRGGPLPNAVSFFTTQEGRALLKRRLRYIVSRWGYSTSLFSWEVIDQLDRAVNTQTATDWLREIVAYLRDVDPYAHLITAGLRDPSLSGLLDPVVLDFKETRFYQRRPIEPTIDQATGTLNALNPFLMAADRPILLTEFSLGPWFEPATDDPKGVHLTETMWAAALSGAGGSAASWWWDTYIFPNGLQNNFGALATFTKDIPFASSDLQPASLTISSDNAEAFESLKVTGFGGTFGAPPGPEVSYRLTPEGIFPPISQQSAFIYGVTYNKQFSRPQHYVITPPIDTMLTVTVQRVSEQAPAKLVIIIDGETVGQAALAPGTQNLAISVPIKAGDHNVVIDNLGDDYLQIASIEIANYIVPLRTLALADRQRGMLIVWAQNRQYTWQNAAQNLAVQPVSATINMNEMPAGLYNVELWDTTTGNVIGEEQVYVTGVPNGTLSISLIPISEMLAIKAIRVAEPANLPTTTPIPTATPRIVPTVPPNPTPTAGVVG